MKYDKNTIKFVLQKVNKHTFSFEGLKNASPLEQSI